MRTSSFRAFKSFFFSCICSYKFSNIFKNEINFYIPCPFCMLMVAFLTQFNRIVKLMEEYLSQQVNATANEIFNLHITSTYL